MTFPKEIHDQCMADLPGDVVKRRKQAGQQLSYVEGWWVKDKALRIFGAGSFGKSVDKLECVAAHEEEKNGKMRWRVSYVATVTVSVHCEGKSVQTSFFKSTDVGAGHGIGSLGDAHESASKEAVTDAMKRAMTDLGRVFGLALYDKNKAHVDTTSTDAAQDPPDPAEIEVTAQIQRCANLKALEGYGKSIATMGLTGQALINVRAAFKLRATAMAATEDEMKAFDVDVEDAQTVDELIHLTSDPILDNFPGSRRDQVLEAIEGKRLELEGGNA